MRFLLCVSGVGLVLYEAREATCISLGILADPAITTVCYTWSGSKGKAIICGMQDGSMRRFKIDDDRIGVKFVETKPPCAIKEQDIGYLAKAHETLKEEFQVELNRKVTNIAWLDKEEFIVTHGADLDYVLTTLKGKPANFCTYAFDQHGEINAFEEDEDDNPEPGIDTQFFFGHIPSHNWNLLLTMNSKSRKTEMLHRKDTAAHWARLKEWHSDDELPKVELPRFDNEDKYEFPLGMGIDLTASAPIHPAQTPNANEEHAHQPSPRMLILTNSGVVAIYQVLNMTADRATPHECMHAPIPLPRQSEGGATNAQAGDTEDDEDEEEEWQDVDEDDIISEVMEKIGLKDEGGVSETVRSMLEKSDWDVDHTVAAFAHLAKAASNTGGQSAFARHLRHGPKTGAQSTTTPRSAGTTMTKMSTKAAAQSVGANVVAATKSPAPSTKACGSIFDGGHGKAAVFGSKPSPAAGLVKRVNSSTIVAQTTIPVASLQGTQAAIVSNEQHQVTNPTEAMSLLNAAFARDVEKFINVHTPDAPDLSALCTQYTAWAGDAYSLGPQ